MLMAAGDIHDRYEVIGLVFGVASRTPESKGCSAPVLGLGQTYEDAAAQLRTTAQARGADAVIHVGFEHRYSTANTGCGGPTVAFEVYAWGTAVKLVR
ncbi:heavy metal-binding domain-containing protein [Hyphomonas sp. NPDC076900]|uniref:heavy metal-binding domain-containing protein n=1 Tax=unclassified Hyphomonas TaxID=2630699 RepID=UPI003D058811